jgi:hypothetical protein
MRKKSSKAAADVNAENGQTLYKAVLTDTSNTQSDPTTTDFRVSADNEYSAKYYCRIFEYRQIEKSYFKPKMTSQLQN